MKRFVLTSSVATSSCHANPGPGQGIDRIRKEAAASLHPRGGNLARAPVGGLVGGPAARTHLGGATDAETGREIAAQALRQGEEIVLTWKNSRSADGHGGLHGQGRAAGADPGHLPPTPRVRNRPWPGPRTSTTSTTRAGPSGWRACPDRSPADVPRGRDRGSPTEHQGATDPDGRAGAFRGGRAVGGSSAGPGGRSRLPCAAEIPARRFRAPSGPHEKVLPAFPLILRAPSPGAPAPARKSPRFLQLQSGYNIVTLPLSFNTRSQGAFAGGDDHD